MWVMAHSICLIKLYQITMRKNFQFFVSDYLKTLEKLRSDDRFNLFWETVTHKANALEVSEPSLPRSRQRPARYASGSATPEFVDNAQDYFRQIYFNAIDHSNSLHKTKIRPTWI